MSLQTAQIRPGQHPSNGTPSRDRMRRRPGASWQAAFLTMQVGGLHGRGRDRGKEICGCGAGEGVQWQLQVWHTSGGGVCLCSSQ